MRARLSDEQLKRTLTDTHRRLQADARGRLRADQHSDPIDEARWSEDAAVAIEELDVSRRTQREAGLALDRMAEGRYGICIDCDREINESRLQALPWATRCVRCATIREFARPGDAREQPRSVKDWLDGAPDAA